MSYQPTDPPNVSNPELQRLASWLANELRLISAAIQNPVFERVTLKQLNVAPKKRQDGAIEYADGTNWNPGAGKGIYWDDGTTRTKL